MQSDFKIMLPIIIINFILIGVSLVDLIRRESSRIRWGKKIIWGLVIVFFGIVGPTAYLILGRVEK